MSSTIYKLKTLKIPYITESAITNGTKAICELDTYIGISQDTGVITWNTSSLNLIIVNADIISEMSVLREGYEEDSQYTADDIDLTLFSNDVFGIWFLRDVLFNIATINAEIRFVIKQKKNDGTLIAAEPIFQGKIDLLNYTYKDLVEESNSMFSLLREYKVKCLSTLINFKDFSIDNLRTYMINYYNAPGQRFYMSYMNNIVNGADVFDNYVLVDNTATKYWAVLKIKGIIESIFRLAYGNISNFSFFTNFAFSGGYRNSDTNGVLPFSEVGFFFFEWTGTSRDFSGFLFDETNSNGASFYNFANCGELLKNLLTTFQIYYKLNMSYSLYEYNFTIPSIEFLPIRAEIPGNVVAPYSPSYPVYINEITSVEIKKEYNNKTYKLTNYGIGDYGDGKENIDIYFKTLTAGVLDSTRTFYRDPTIAQRTFTSYAAYQPQTFDYNKLKNIILNDYGSGALCMPTIGIFYSNDMYATYGINGLRTYSPPSYISFLMALSKCLIDNIGTEKIQIEYKTLMGWIDAGVYLFNNIKPNSTFIYNNKTYKIESIERDLLGISTKITAGIVV